MGCLKTTVVQLFSTCPVAWLMLLLLPATFPVGVKGFGVGYHASVSSSVARRNSAAVGDNSVAPASSAFRNTWAVDRRVGWGVMTKMGAARDGGGNEHKDKKDQREGTEDSSGATGDDLVSGKILMVALRSWYFGVRLRPRDSALRCVFLKKRLKLVAKRKFEIDGGSCLHSSDMTSAWVAVSTGYCWCLLWVRARNPLSLSCVCFRVPCVACFHINRVY